jgi:hypothetical protein
VHPVRQRRPLPVRRARICRASLILRVLCRCQVHEIYALVGLSGAPSSVARAAATKPRTLVIFTVCLILLPRDAIDLRRLQ